MGAGASSSAGDDAGGQSQLAGKENSDPGDDATDAGDYDDYDQMVHRINTVGPEPQPLLQYESANDVQQLENPARGFQPCATMELFKKHCGGGIMGRQVTVNPKVRQALLGQYFGPAAEERMAAERDDRNNVLATAKQELIGLKTSRNPREILAGLSKFRAMGQAVAAERATLKARCAKLTDRARAKMAQALVRADTRAEDIVHLLDRCTGWPNLDTEREALTQHMVDRLVAAYSLPDLQLMDAVLDEYACSAAYTGSTLAGLRRNRERLVDIMRSRMEQARDWKDPRDIAKLLKQTKTSEEVADLREELRVRLGKLCDLVIQVLDPLCTSDDFPLIEGTLLKYQSFPENVKDAWESLRERRDLLLTTAKATLAGLLGTHNLVEIDAALARYADYAEAVESERVAVMDHRKWLLRNAILEMRALVDSTSATVVQLAAALERYEHYPNVQEELQDLSTRVVQLVSEACTLKDIQSVAKAVDDCGYAEKYAPQEYEQLLNNYSLLAESMKIKLRQTITRRVPLEMEQALEESRIYGVGVHFERDALEAALQELIVTATREIEQLLDGSDFVAIDNAVSKYRGYLVSTQAVWLRLEAHRDELVQSARRELIAMLESSDGSAVETTLQTYQSYAGALRTELSSLEEWRDRLVMVDVLEDLCSSTDFKAVLAGLKKYKFCERDERAQAAWDRLELWRDSLVHSAKSALTSVASSRSFEEVEATLEAYADYGDFVHAELVAVSKWRDRLSVVRELENQCDSDDFAEIEGALKRFLPETGEPAVLHAHRLLQTRRDQMVAAVQMALRQLLEYVAPVAMGTALERYAAYKVACSQEFSLVEARRWDLIADANAKLNAAASNEDATIPEMQELITAYYGFPEEEVGAAMERLKSKLAEVIAKAERLARQRKARADAIRSRREQQKNGSQSSKQLLLNSVRTTLQAEAAFSLGSKSPDQSAAAEGKEKMKHQVVEAGETEDVIMDGVDSILSGDMHEAVNSFMASLESKPRDPVCAYNLACCHSLMGQPDSAIRWFDLAVQWGIKSHDELGDPSQDPDLAPLASDERFVALLAQLA